MRSAKIITFTGIALLVFAWVSAAFIPNQAQEDYSQFVRTAGGRLSHTPGFPDAYKQMSANRRMLQNFYIGAAGLIWLGVGLCSWKQQVKTIAAPNGGSATPPDNSSGA